MICENCRRATKASDGRMEHGILIGPCYCAVFSGVLTWKDISVETERTYTFAGGEKVRIFKPVRLSVSNSGGHRVVDAANHGHYIPPTWIHIEWIVADGMDPVVA